MLPALSTNLIQITQIFLMYLCVIEFREKNQLIRLNVRLLSFKKGKVVMTSNEGELENIMQKRVS